MIPKNIPENHRATLRSVASQKNISENELVRLYQAAEELRANGVCSAQNVMPSKLEQASTDGKIVLVTVTNHVGVYAQLAQQAAGPIMLTLGQKYSMEGMDQVNRQVATRMF